MSFLIDVTIIVLLLGTVGYAFLVDRRVRKLMLVLRDLEPMVGEFSAAVDKSQSSVGTLASLAQRLPAGLGASAPEPEEDEPASFRAPRAQPARRPAGVARVPGKNELVRGFFETAQKNEV